MFIKIINLKPLDLLHYFTPMLTRKGLKLKQKLGTAVVLNNSMLIHEKYSITQAFSSWKALVKS